MKSLEAELAVVWLASLCMQGGPGRSWRGAEGCWAGASDGGMTMVDLSLCAGDTWGFSEILVKPVSVN